MMPLLRYEYDKSGTGYFVKCIWRITALDMLDRAPAQPMRILFTCVPGASTGLGEANDVTGINQILSLSNGFLPSSLHCLHHMNQRSATGWYPVSCIWNPTVLDRAPASVTAPITSIWFHFSPGAEIITLHNPWGSSINSNIMTATSATINLVIFGSMLNIQLC